MEFQMHDEYKAAILEQLDDMLQSGINNSVNYTVMLMVRDALVAKGLAIHLSEAIVAKAQIIVDDNIYADRVFMTTVIDKYTDVIVEMHKFAGKNFHNIDNFMHLVEGLNLTLVPPRQ